MGMSVDKLAERLNKNRATVYRYESDEIENFPVSTLEPLAHVLNVTPAFLMGWQSQSEMINEFKISKLLADFNKLNDIGKKEAHKRVEELTQISKYARESDYLVLNAAHEIEGASEEDKKHDDDIMDDENF